MNDMAINILEWSLLAISGLISALGLYLGG